MLLHDVFSDLKMPFVPSADPDMKGPTDVVKNLSIYSIWSPQFEAALDPKP